MERHIKAATTNTSGTRRVGRVFRNRLALTTILTVAPFVGYGRPALAASGCDPTGGTTYLCGGTNGATLEINADNATVSTAAGFSVNAAAGNGITITGEGKLTFTDANASPITSANANGLEVKATGNYGIEGEGGIVGEVMIETNGNITGGRNGIYAENEGSGNLDITANGQVIGQNGAGIFARNSFEGLYPTAVDDNGIFMDNPDDATALTVTTGVGSVVEGGYEGIYAEQRGNGDLTITVNGAVTGKRGDGIQSENYGFGETKITIGSTGRVEGRFSAIKAESDFGRDISVTNYGLVRNLSGNSDDLAIRTGGGNTTIENRGVLIGTVSLGIEDEDFDGFSSDTLINSGLWNTAGGTNRFAAGRDEVINSGILVAANDATQVEETELFGLEKFDNDGGLISLVDGAVGDTLTLFGEGGGEGEDVGVYDDRNRTYLATDGRLAVDAVLGDGEAGKSDILEIYGDVGLNSPLSDHISEGGITWVSVNVLDALGANLDGIPVVRVMGNTGEGDFQLDGPLYAGFYAWDMRYDRRDDVHELYTSGIGVGAYEFAAGITGAQDMWFQSTGLLMQRQADLRPLIAGMQVTPVADFAQPVEATPVAKVLPGFWMRGVGAWLERDDEQDGFTLDRMQTVFGGMAGFDFGTENVAGQGDALIFGLFGGYLTSELDFKETNSEWSYQGPSLGVYASYLTGAFYADATVKADFLDISIDPEDLAPAADESDTDGLNIGAMLDAGYRFGSGGGVFFEPQATLALLHTSIDDVDVFGGTVEFDNDTSLRGRLGLRLGYDHTAGNAVVYSSDVTASVWQNFSGENGATIVDPLIPAFGVADDPARTYGDVSLGFSATGPEGWSGFLRGNYQFGDGYEAFAGNAGVRVAW